MGRLPGAPARRLDRLGARECGAAGQKAKKAAVGRDGCAIIIMMMLLMRITILMIIITLVMMLILMMVITIWSRC